MNHKMISRRLKRDLDQVFEAQVEDCLTAKLYYDLKEAGCHDGLSLLDYMITYGDPVERAIALEEWDSRYLPGL